MRVAPDELWQLPGPGRFVKAVQGALSDGQHSMVVLPRWMYEGTCSNDLAHEIAAVDGGYADVLVPEPSAQGLAEALAAAAWIDDPPVTVRSLLRHEDVRGRTFVCDATDLTETLRQELPAFVRGLERESSTMPRHERCTFALLVEHGDLPKQDAGSATGVAVEQHWYWNRMARWDVAAFLDARQDPRPSHLVEVVRREVVIEVAGWDLTLAAEIDVRWRGEVGELASYLTGDSQVDIGRVRRRREHERRPPESLLDIWDDGAVDCWDGSVSVASARRGLGALELDRLVWQAQARILLPWLEVRRARLEDAVRSALGASVFEEWARRLDRYGAWGERSVAEIGMLHAMVARTVGGRKPQLRSTAAKLLGARNKLSHLEPMSRLDIRQLVEVSHWLE
jgi:hypothetical protein